MDEMEDKYNALLIEHKAKDAEQLMMAALRQTPISQICYAFRSRVKTEDRLIEKKARKLPEKPEYKLEDITDVIGVRHNGCQLKAKKRPTPCNVGYARNEHSPTQSHNQGGRSWISVSHL